MQQPGNAHPLVRRMDAVHAAVSAGLRELFRLILQAERLELWREDGARDIAH